MKIVVAGKEIRLREKDVAIAQKVIILDSLVIGIQQAIFL